MILFIIIFTENLVPFAKLWWNVVSKKNDRHTNLTVKTYNDIHGNRGNLRIQLDNLQLRLDSIGLYVVGLWLHLVFCTDGGDNDTEDSGDQ